MSDKNIIRVEKNKNFVAINRTVLNDVNLSWKAKGIMVYMLAMPDDWVFYMDELMTHSTDGKSSFRSGFNELKKGGYIQRKRSRQEDGTFEWMTIVYEVPLTDYPQVDKPVVDKPQVDNRTLLSTDELSTDKLKIDYSYIVGFLNKKTDKNFRHSTKKTQSLIRARFNEGFTEDDFIEVINKKVYEWIDDEGFKNYLRPETLFGTKFEGYLNQEYVRSNNLSKSINNEHQIDEVRKGLGIEQRRDIKHVRGDSKRLPQLRDYDKESSGLGEDI